MGTNKNNTEGTVKKEQRMPQVGDPCTMASGSDRYPGTLERVSSSGKEVWVRHDRFRRVDSNGPFTEMQTYEYTRNPDGALYSYTRRQDGRWLVKGDSLRSSHVLYIGERRAYFDPHF